MKLVKVEFLEESSKAAFFDVTVIKSGLWRKSYELTRKATIEKLGNCFWSFFMWSETGETCHSSNIVQEMILQYEKRKER